MDKNSPRPAPRFEVRFAETPAEILETQGLRYRIFAGELGATIDGGDAQIDADQYDAYCRHLMVREAGTGKLVACTRILTDDMAALAGGFYSSGEFDLKMIDSLPAASWKWAAPASTRNTAAARSSPCCGPAWAISSSARGFDYLFGCASIGLEDGAPPPTPCWSRSRPSTWRRTGSMCAR